MSSDPGIGEDLIRRLPLPLAKLYRLAANAKSPLDRHQAAYFLWEAALKLLSAAAVVSYADRREHDPKVTERLTNLARPALGHWWEFVRLLVPALAVDDAGFGDVREAVLGRSRGDMPWATGLDSVLREVLEGTSGARSSVRLTELFDRLVRYRNHELGHGAPGLRPSAFYDRVGRALMSGVPEILDRMDSLAGRSLIYVAEVSRQSSGGWLIERFELTGETPRRLEPRRVTQTDAEHLLPHPGQLYLEARGEKGTGGEKGTAHARSLHPLVVYDAESAEVFFLNARRGAKRSEYLSYSSGRVIEQSVIGGEPRELLARLLDLPTVDTLRFGDWAARSQAEEPTDAAAVEHSAARSIGEFELLSKLGQGGMGVVYRAWQPSIGRQVALKCLMRSGDPKSEARFAGEIRALGSVDHPHLVKVFASGSDGDQYFYAMELVEGATLATVCERLQTMSNSAADVAPDTWRQAVSTACEETRRSERPITAAPSPASAVVAAVPGETPREADQPPPLAVQSYVRHIVELIRQTTTAVQKLHETGVVHRDIKPENIMLSADGSQAVLMDLGLAQWADKAKLTRTRQFVGTLRYASPEQVMAVDRLDGRSDVYSLGATLWELLALRPMFGANEDTPTPTLMKQIQYEDPPPANKLNRAVPADLAAIVAKCLEKNPAKRYAKAADLADDLGRWLRDEPVSIPSMNWTYRPKKFLARHRWSIAATLAAMVLAVAGYWFWCDSYVWPNVNFYSWTVQRNRVSEGYGRPLTVEELSHTEQAVRIVRQGRRGLVTRVEVTDSRGRMHPDRGFTNLINRSSSSGPSISSIDYTYRNGVLATETARDYWGAEVWTFEYKAPAAGQKVSTGGHYMRDGLVLPLTNSGAAFVEFEYSPEGWMTGMRYTDSFGHPRPDPEGSFGTRRVYSADGLMLEEIYLGRDGQPANSRKGYARVKNEYDDRGNRIRLETYGTDGKLRNRHEGWAGYSAQFDPWSNTVRIDYFDQNRQPLLPKVGFALITYKYDDAGNQIERTFGDADGSLLPTIDNIYGWTNTYDDDSNIASRTFFGKNRQPKLDKDDKVAGWSARYENHREIERYYVGIDGKPKVNSKWVAGYRTEYDARGDAVARHYFDERGVPCLEKKGGAGWIARYDARDRMIERTLIGLDHRAIVVPGVATTTLYAYDDTGNLTRVEWLDVDRKPFGGDEAASIEKYRYDEHGRQIEAAYYKAGDLRVLSSKGIAGWRTEYDARGNITGQLDFGVNEALREETAGGAGWIARYDAQDRQIERTIVDAARKPKPLAKPATTTLSVYDEAGNLIEVKWLDEKRKPLGGTAAASVMKYQYDSRGRQTEIGYFKSGGGRVSNVNGIGGQQSEYDAQGNITAEYFFDTKHAPCDSETLKYAGWTARYDDQDRVVEKTFVGVDHKPIALSGNSTTSISKYDDADNLVEGEWLDVDHQPLGGPDAMSMVRYRYDRLNRQIEVSYHKPNGEPALNSSDIASRRNEYDANGNLAAERYFGIDGKPVADKWGTAAIVIRYRANDTVASRDHRDLLGRSLIERPRVSDVPAGSPAEKSGMKVGDILLRYAGEEPHTYESFFKTRHEHTHDLQPLTFRRGGEVLTISLPGEGTDALFENCWLPPADAAAPPAPPPAANPPAAKSPDTTPPVATPPATTSPATTAPKETAPATAPPHAAPSSSVPATSPQSPAKPSDAPPTPVNPPSAR